MVKKKTKVERKPTPAKYLISSLAFFQTLRRQRKVSPIAVRLPQHLHNVLWITENFQISKKFQDLVLPPEKIFVVANVVKRLNEFPRTYNQQNAHLCSDNRFCAIIEMTTDAIKSESIPFTPEDYDVLFWFYSEDDPIQQAGMVRRFANHMHWDDSIQESLIIDKWSHIPSVQDHYIPLGPRRIENDSPNS